MIDVRTGVDQSEGRRGLAFPHGVVQRGETTLPVDQVRVRVAVLVSGLIVGADRDLTEIGIRERLVTALSRTRVGRIHACRVGCSHRGLHFCRGGLPRRALRLIAAKGGQDLVTHSASSAIFRRRARNVDHPTYE